MNQFETPINLLKLPNGQSVKGILFDLNGTMVDDMMIHHKAWKKKLAEHGLDLTLEEVRQTIHGVNEEILERLFGHKYSVEQRKQIAWEKEAAYREIFKPDLKLIDGLPAFLASLTHAGIPMAIGTAAPKENADFVLDELNMRSMFGALVHSGDVEKGKPNPEVFEKAAKGIHLEAKDCLIFEDSPTGAEAAYNAGAPVIIITTTHTSEEFAHLTNVVHTMDNYNNIHIKNAGEDWKLDIG
ncbi:MAG: HAD family phosphatase [Bacteroidota bacterium]